jgi:uncharacterized protein
MNYVAKFDPVLLVFSVMVISGIMKEVGSSSSIQWLVSKVTTSKRASLALVAAILGVLPIPGRVTAICGTLNAIQRTPSPKSGVISFMSSHHYYLWSPLEKSVILAMAAMGVSYVGWLSVMWPAIVTGICIPFIYIFYNVKEEELYLVNVSYGPPPRQHLLDLGILLLCFSLGCLYPYIGLIFFTGAGLILLNHGCNWNDALSHVDLKIIGLVAGVIVLSILAQTYTESITQYVTSFNSIAFGMVACFVGSFILGSSSRFAGITVAAGLVYGIEWIPIFYLIDYFGYLLSPTHKCVMIGCSYFKSNPKEYILPVIAQGSGTLIMYLLIRTVIG